jgi:hypothetical protein
MSPILLPPEHEPVSLFTPAHKKAKRKKPKKPMPAWMKMALVLYTAAITESFGSVGAQFGTIAWHNPGDPHVMAGMGVAFVLCTAALIAGAVATKTSLNLLGFA